MQSTRLELDEARAVVALGSNHQPKQHLQRAIQMLESRFTAIQLSPAYWSKAVSIEGNDFINIIASFQADLALPELNQCLKQLEATINDHQPQKFRAIDIDLLLYGNRSNHQLPHPDLLNYRFIAQPLADIFPHYQIPGQQQTFLELAHRLEAQMPLIATSISKKPLISPLKK